MNREDDATLAAYRVMYPDGPAFSSLSDDDRTKWRRAFGEARRIEPTVLKTEIPLELTESSLEYALRLLGHPSTATIFCSDYYGRRAEELCGKFGFAYCELPWQTLTTRYAWVVKSPDGMVWSAPVD